MQDDQRIVTTYDNKQVELVFNESFLCPTRDIGILDINLGKKIFDWKMRLIFDSKEGEKPFLTTWEYNVDGFHLKVTFHNWISNNWVELSNAHQVYNQSSNFYLKIRSEASPSLGGARNVHISIWKAI